MLSGSKALGSWQAGAFTALAGREMAIDWIVGASAGALNAAVIAGNPPMRAVDRPRAFWTPAADEGFAWWPAGIDA